MKVSMEKIFVTMVLSLVIVFGLVACSGGSQSLEDSTGGDGTIGGEDLNVMLETPVQSLDPQVATDGTSFEVIADYTDGLMQMDEDGKAVPALAESYEISDDGRTFTFYLRDAKWSNGTPVTAGDFVFAWQRAVDPELSAQYSTMLSDICQIKNAKDIVAGIKDKSELGVTAVDDKTLKVDLDIPVSYFLSLMYFPTFYPVNEEFFNSVGASNFGTSPETVLSNGAFVLDEYQPGATTFHLRKNEDYWDAGRVKLPGIGYQVIKDYQQAYQSYQTGDLDITLISGDLVDQAAGNEDFHSINSGYLWYVSPNQNGQSANPALKNQKLRLAMTMALNREEITLNVLNDGSVPTYTAVPKGFAIDAEGNDFSQDQTMFYDVCSYDEEKAAKLWKEGLKEEGIESVNLTMLVDDDDVPKKVSKELKKQWESTLPGLKVALQWMPKKNRSEEMENDRYEIALTRWGPDYADPMTYLGMWVTGNNNNFGFWSDEAYDAIIADCTTGEASKDAQVRWYKMYDAEKILMDDAVIYPIYTQFNAELISPTVSGVEFHPVGVNRVYKNAVKK